MPAEWAQVIATFMAPLVTITVAAVAGVWTLKTWRDDREKQRKEEQKQREKEQLRLAALLYQAIFDPCERLQSRLYNIFASGGLRALKKSHPEGDFAEDTLYPIVQFFGWQQFVYRYYYDWQVIQLFEELRALFATDRTEYGGVGPFCFFRSQQRAFADMIMLRTEGPFGSEYVTRDYNEFLRMLKTDPFARSQSVNDTLEMLRNAEAASDIPLGVRKRLVRIQNLLVELLEYLERKEGISYFPQEGGRKRAL
jgi:hypothetical protein